MKRSLQEIVDEMIAVMEEIEDGEITDEMYEALFADAGAALGDKVDAFAAVVRQLGTREEAMKTMAAHYAAKAATAERQAKALKQRMFDAMQALGTKKIVGSTATAAIQLSNPRLVIDPGVDPRLLEGDMAVYQRITYDLDRTRIKADAVAGKGPEWAKIERGSHIRFR